MGILGTYILRFLNFNYSLHFLTASQVLAPSYPPIAFWLVLILGLGGCRQLEFQVSRLAPLPQDPKIQVYLNHNPATTYTEPYRPQTRPGDDLERLVVEPIQSAKSSLDVAVHELRLPRIAQALAERQRAGVRVRVILENTYSHPWSPLARVTQLDPRGQNQYEEYRQLIDRNGDRKVTQSEINRGDALTILQNAGIPWIDDTADGSKGSGLMHHKFVVVDRRTVIVTSANFTLSDMHGDLGSPISRGNPNALLKLENPALAATFSQEFDLMWGDGPEKKPDSRFGLAKPFRPAQVFKLGKTTVAVQFSPTSKTVPWEQTANGLIGRTLNQATTAVDLALFVFSEQPLSNILAAKHRQGVEIRALIEPDYAYKSYSEGLDMLGVALAQSEQVGDPGYCRFEAGNIPWQQPIKTVGIPRLPKGDRLHHKFGVVDHKIVIVGSHNWSQAADENNDENLLVISSPTVAAHFNREFEQLYDKAELGLPRFLLRQIQLQQVQCQAVPARASLAQSSPVAPSATIFPTGVSQSPTTERVNLNSASQAELETLPGVGPKLAKQIIAARHHKPFMSLSDLDQVPGVGPLVLKQLQNQVTW